MQQLIERERAAFIAFLEQRDYGVLVVRAAGEQIGYAIQILKSIEDGGSPDVFVAFAHDFVSPAEYASLVADRVKASERAVREELGEKAAGLPQMPELCLDKTRDPALRIRESLEYARTLLPKDTEQRMIVAFLPMRILEAGGYAQLMGTVVQPQSVPPWYRRMRIIVREDTTVPTLPPGLPSVPFIAVHHLDLSHDAIVASLEQTANNDAADRDQRAQSLLQLAYIDQAHGRVQAALSKFQDLLAYYSEVGNSTMLALAISGVGNVYQSSGDLVRAKEWHSRAIAPAGESKSPIILFTVARNLGQVAFELGQFLEAESFFDSAGTMGIQIHDPDSVILALEWKAMSAVQLAAYDRARVSLSQALAKAREFQKSEHEARIYARLQGLGSVN